MNPIDLLKKYGIRPRKFLGQNFLTDQNVIRNIVDFFSPQVGEKVLEIGSGLGAMTGPLLERGAWVVGVEKDRELCELLKREFEFYGEKFEVIEEDILDFDFEKRFKSRKVRVIGNIPYYLTSPIIFRLIEEREHIRSSTLMIQKEVADRLLATPGTGEYGRLTVAVRFFAEVKKLAFVSRNSFFPPPNVDSAVICLKFHSMSQIRKTGIRPQFFPKLVKAAFSQRRKKILNCLAHSGLRNLEKEEWNQILEDSGIDPSKRAEELFLKDFILLCRKLEFKVYSNKRKTP